MGGHQQGLGTPSCPQHTLLSFHAGRTGTVQYKEVATQAFCCHLWSKVQIPPQSRWRPQSQDKLYRTKCIWTLAVRDFFFFFWSLMIWIDLDFEMGSLITQPTNIYRVPLIWQGTRHEKQTWSVPYGAYTDRSKQTIINLYFCRWQMSNA